MKLNNLKFETLKFQPTSDFRKTVDNCRSVPLKRTHNLPLSVGVICLLNFDCMYIYMQLPPPSAIKIDY